LLGIVRGLVTDRVLIVEDHEQWRRYISAAIQATPRWQIVGEASDGLEAVQKAEELKPDLILMDVGLPTVNGLEAARRMLARDPLSRILFVSEHQSWHIAEAAFEAGARGYVVKSDAGGDLSRAMDTVVGGRRFVSARWGGRLVAAANDHNRSMPEARRHEIGFYSDDRSLLEVYAGFAEAALVAGSAVIILVNDSRRDKLLPRLRARGVDIDRAMEDRRCISIDPAAALSGFMVDGWPDEARFWKATSSLMMGAARASKSEHPRVAVCGDGAGGLVRDGRAQAALRLEQLWDEVARTYDVDVFCPYSANESRSAEDTRVLEEICAAHSAVHFR
jgi:DNA-binding NarL/FixJ family response regulator